MSGNTALAVYIESFTNYLLQVLNLMNVLFNFYFLQIFLNKRFYNLGWRWLEAQDDYGKSFSVLTDIFPKMTICPWKQFGSGGEIEERYFLCLLGTNRITEKIFVFIWFWLIFLLITSTCSICYYCLLLFSKNEKWRDRFIAISINDTKVLELQQRPNSWFK